MMYIKTAINLITKTLRRRLLIRM